jgi:hypothetical protein
MRVLTEQDRKRLWAEVVAEFPGDHVMQEVHYVRLVHGEMLKDESPEARTAFFQTQARKALQKAT